MFHSLTDVNTVFFCFVSVFALLFWFFSVHRKISTTDFAIYIYPYIYIYIYICIHTYIHTYIYIYTYPWMLPISNQQKKTVRCSSLFRKVKGKNFRSCRLWRSVSLASLDNDQQLNRLDTLFLSFSVLFYLVFVCFSFLWWFWFSFFFLSDLFIRRD